MKNNLTNFGFNFGRNSAHTARTMMLNELQTLLAYVNNPIAEKSDYRRVVEDENCLSKRSGKTRTLSFRHLTELYGLDPDILLFRVLLFLWGRDPAAQPQLALLCAYARDTLLRSAVPLVLDLPNGARLSRETMEEFIEGLEPGRFSPATLKSTAQNLNSSLTQSGHLNGRVRKIRDRVTVSSGSISYALFMGYLTGARGEFLFRSEYIKLLDCPFDKAIELAEEASRKGWVVFKRVGDVIEVLFPNLINQKEMELLQ
ncbi:MAG: hypothetical protein J7L25_12105 [Deltaproteobacteria bacterium]|nr:hypothetical protein [Candidatus Tharpella aukensis]